MCKYFRRIRPSGIQNGSHPHAIELHMGRPEWFGTGYRGLSLLPGINAVGEHTNADHEIEDVPQISL